MAEDAEGAGLPLTAESQPRVFIWRRWEQLAANLDKCLAYVSEMHECYKKHNKEQYAQWCLLVFAMLKEVRDRLEDLKGWG
jgi:hypothetical protein